MDYSFWTVDVIYDLVFCWGSINLPNLQLRNEVSSPDIRSSQFISGHSF